MRFGLLCLVICLTGPLTGCGTLQANAAPALTEVVPEGGPAPRLARPAPPGPAVAPPLPRVEVQPADEAATMALLRSHLLQLLPCDRGRSGHVQVQVAVADDGAPLSLSAGEHDLLPDAVRCVLSRLAWWSFPAPAGRGATQGQGVPRRSEISFTVTFPLQPPSINDYAAVLVPGGGTLDVPGATAELRRMRAQVLGCYRERRDEASPLMLLLWVRLGEWGKMLGAGVEAESGAGRRPFPPQDRGCLGRVLRQARFPNPIGGEVELRFPYVMVR